MISSYLLGILRCPDCVNNESRNIDNDLGKLEIALGCWLICKYCGRKYPIRDEIPTMLIEEGDKWINIAVENLSVPPPAG